jgi:glycerol-3-phosphate acyltransferase PlsY
VNIALFALAVAYLAGAIPFGYLVVRLTAGADVRRAGSGNIGATNVMRTTGVAAGVATLALDAAKGWFAVWFMDWATGGEPIWLAMAALAAMAGHAFPVFLKFRGGKAVATFFGAWLYIAPIPAGAVLIVLVVTVLYSRHVSLGSIAAAATFPFGVWMIEHPGPAVVLMAGLSGGLIIWRHADNLRRLREGSERILRFRRAR